VGLHILCIELVPALFQKFVVQPSELRGCQTTEVEND
jgi:hypothetical protein